MIQENVRQDLLAFVPSSILGEVKCFVFYDNHPRADRQIDVLVCTQRKEVIEFYKREQISSLLLNTSQNFREVRCFRNVNCELFYFVATDDELFIVSSKNSLDLVHRLTDVDSFEVFDIGCSGKACLKVISKDDAVPLLFDENFKIISERNIEFDAVNSDESAPIIMQLTRKLKEVEYNIKCNENKYNEYLNLRKMATFHLYQKISPNLNESLFNLNSKEIVSSMNLKTWSPWIKLCNKKVVVAFNLLNNNNVLLEDVYVLLNSTTKRSLVYITKLFHQTQDNWLEIEQHIKPNTTVTVATCIDLKELQHDATSGLKFDMVLSFKKSGENYLLPFEKVSISASDVMGENFDVLASNKDEQQTFLSICATSETMTLVLRHIKDEREETLVDIFSKYLKMEQFKTRKNVFIHKSSPYHALYGIMVICQNGDVKYSDKFTIEVHSRCQSQIVSLIHYINDVVPFRIIVTTPNYKITSDTTELTNYNEEIVDNEQNINYMQLASSALNQTSMLLEYLDLCMIQMNMSKDYTILNKVGSEIDLFACGLDKFIEFRNRLLKEVYTGIQKCGNNNDLLLLRQNSVEIIDDEM
ncbi:PREDICTED: uncharacterized protein LOC106114077 [Papilio xuthus]|uniref:Uncharacterized protein LOC106114077 n=1 Tax=Papilio xuthus TaxID=66420 RepID=A0AAJ7E4P7_PAPXU|nr:PREDICTED: uncharacterized protein LOC106114077 [Papilio xuthus]